EFRRVLFRSCLFFPWHAALGTDIPDLLRARLISPAAGGGRPLDLLPRRLVLRTVRVHAEHLRLPGGDPARSNCQCIAWPMGGGIRSRPLAPADDPQDHRTASDDGGIASLRERDHPAPQGLGNRGDHHRIRPDGRDAARLCAHLRLPDLYLGCTDLPGPGGTAADRHREGRSPADPAFAAALTAATMD